MFVYVCITCVCPCITCVCPCICIFLNMSLSKLIKCVCMYVHFNACLSILIKYVCMYVHFNACVYVECMSMCHRCSSMYVRTFSCVYMCVSYAEFVSIMETMADECNVSVGMENIQDACMYIYDINIYVCIHTRYGFRYINGI